MPPQIKPLLSASNLIPDIRMQSRDHPLNSSTRPLLERKHFAPSVQPKKKQLHGFNDFNSIPRQYNSLGTPRMNMYGEITTNDFKFSDERDDSDSSFDTPQAVRRDYAAWKPVPPPRVPPPVNSHNDQDNKGPFVFGVSQNSFLPAYGNGNNVPVIAIKNSNCAPKYSDGVVDGSPNTSQSDTSASSKTAKKDRRKLVKEKKNSKKRKGAEPETAIDKCDSRRHSTKSPGIKCVLVGDGTAGKTNLILSYLQDGFVPDSTRYNPTAFDKYNVEVRVDGSPCNVTICDTAGQDTLDPLRKLCYPNSDVFLLCFSVVNPETFKSIESKWIPELKEFDGRFLLIGTHSDLRTDGKTIAALQAVGEKPVSVADAWDLARNIGTKYIETTVYSKEKIKEVFDTVIWDALQSRHRPRPLWKRMLCLA